MVQGEWSFGVGLAAKADADDGRCCACADGVEKTFVFAEAERAVRRVGVDAALLQAIGSNLVGEADAAAFLRQEADARRTDASVATRRR